MGDCVTYLVGSGGGQGENWIVLQYSQALKSHDMWSLRANVPGCSTRITVMLVVDKVLKISLWVQDKKEVIANTSAYIPDGFFFFLISWLPFTYFLKFSRCPSYLTPSQVFQEEASDWFSHVMLANKQSDWFLLLKLFRCSPDFRIHLNPCHLTWRSFLIWILFIFLFFLFSLKLQCFYIELLKFFKWPILLSKSVVLSAQNVLHSLISLDMNI